MRPNGMSLFLPAAIPTLALAGPFVPGLGAVDVFERAARIRSAAEVGVLILQGVGLLALVGLWSAPTAPVRARRQSLLVSCLAGLGALGSICALHHSDFTLFAGASLVALMIATLFVDAPADAPLPLGAAIHPAHRSARPHVSTRDAASRRRPLATASAL